MKNNQQVKLASLLRKAGMKITPGHLEILSIISKVKKPISSQDIIDIVGERLDPATVYRCMTKLKNSGIIRQIDLRQNHAHYEFFDMAHHHHIICLECGKIEDITGCNLEDMNKRILEQVKQFSQIRTHSLEFYGLCKVCSAKKSLS